MRNLVVVMAGDDSLHEQYTSGRDFELWVCYWGDDRAIASRYRQTCDRFFELKGQKWALVREIGRIARRDGFRAFSEYDYVFLPDDDIAFPGGPSGISDAFALAKEIGADVFQPAITNENVSWEPTARVPGCLCRATNVVEIMMPAYSGEVFESCVLPVLHVHIYINVGWGLEPLIARLGEAMRHRPIRTFVLDNAPAIHTRPVGQGTTAHSVGLDEAFMNPLSTGRMIREFARFTDAREAYGFEFPEMNESIDREAIEKHLWLVHGTRELYEMTREKGLASYVLKRLMKTAARRARR